MTKLGISEVKIIVLHIYQLEFIDCYPEEIDKRFKVGVIQKGVRNKEIEFDN